MKNGTFAAAQALHLQGDLDGAESLYREVLRATPDDAEAIQGLGVLAYQEGRAEEAANIFGKGVEVSPTSAVLHANYGEALRTLHRLDEAASRLERALALDANLPDAWNSLGLVEIDRGRFAEAENAFRRCIELRDDSAASYVNLGVALQARELGDEAARAFESALAVDPDNLAALMNLGTILCEAGEAELTDRAVSLFLHAAAVAPASPEVMNNLGNALRQADRLAEALDAYLKGLELNPSDVIPRFNIAQLLKHWGQYDDAAALYEEAHEIVPDTPRYHVNLGGLYAARRRQADAARHFRLALELDSKNAEARQGLAQALLDLGRLDEAEPLLVEAVGEDPADVAALIALARLQAERGEFEASCRTARDVIALRPNLAEPYCQLAINLKGKMPDHEVGAMRGMIEQRYRGAAVLGFLSFHLAEVLDARGLREEACARFESANAFVASDWSERGEGYDPDHYSQFVDRMITAFPREFLEARRGWGDPDPRPIFVVGFPRSGTTLTEQILASHPAVHGAGELTEAYQVLEELPRIVGLDSEDVFEALAALTPATALAAASQYLRQLDAISPCSASRVVDKMPENLQILGLIALLWPGARVVRCTRDPRDVAVSCWQTNFAKLPWTNQYDHIARRFADDLRLLDHWRGTGMIHWLDFSYEQLVDDPDGQTRRLLAEMGLDWDPACLNFHSTRRVVRTASMLQVRQPVYSRSVGRWRQYQTTLRPLFEALERHGVVGGAD